MEYKYEKLTDKIYVCASSDHRFGTDAFLLADFSQYRQKDKACDLGTGCGIIPLIMQKYRPPQVTYAVDIQEGAIEQLRLGLEKSETSGIVPICADLKELWEDAPIGQLDLVTCNPPYKVNNAGFQSVITAQKIARHEILCTIDDVCAAAKKLLKYGGRLCVCNRPERLSDVIFAMKNNDIEPKRLRFVSKNPDEAPWLFLIEGKKGSKPFMKVEPQLYIRSENGFTEELQRIYDTGKDEQ
ncbi:tRNA1(Val) (adenine(37)-N6)-methyltransferase [Ruminococcus sp. XPD3002]|uniref:tRNA1(Val) (adenine(37)-N6)-methyltransferase n=1 Tax=Ruminococcus sp. XPD3002 TaxID=1452269 RepID=UPI0009222A59|nr:tRNA1(Val) A37 N6-methylase TrmN6 [Ruminococcus flavefaciens]